MRVELSNGGWAELRPPSEVAERNRRKIQLAMFRVSAETREALATTGEDRVQAVSGALKAEDVGVLYEINDLLIVALVKAWSLQTPALPLTLETVGDLTGADYDALLKATSVHVSAMMPDFGTEDPTEPTTDAPALVPVGS
ncbi:MAG: hypothetical protein ACYDAD_11200 [Acidimicrobiales bacterium]